jgi:beta-lactamase class A
MLRPRIAVAALLGLLLLAACTPAAPQAAVAPSPAPAAPQATIAPSPLPPTPVPPSPTPAPTFTAGSRIGGVDVTGLTLAEATVRLQSELAAMIRPLTVRADAAELRIVPEAIDLNVPIDDLLAAAAPALSTNTVADVPLSISFDENALRERLAALAEQAGSAPEISLLTSTNVLSRSFAYTPGRLLDADAAVKQFRSRIESARPGSTLNLRLVPSAEAPQVSMEALEAAIADLAEEWPGVVGFHLHDLTTGESIGYQDGTVFAGASTIKTAIMLYAYMNVAEFDATEERWLKRMIGESDNLSANGLLASGAGGSGTEWAFVGADAMSTLLQEELGLEHTYLYVPYETTDYIKLYKPSYRCGPQGRVGDPPYTEMGACLRATPASMARLYRLIDECTNDEGILPEQYELLTPERCREMLDRLAENGDDTRMVAGIPAGVRVEHKSGWIENMQADAGIVRSPGGDYVVAIYIYRPLTGGRDLWADEVMAPVVAAFSRLAYTAYNPVMLEE